MMHMHYFSRSLRLPTRGGLPLFTESPGRGVFSQTSTAPVLASAPTGPSLGYPAGLGGLSDYLSPLLEFGVILNG
jgi:hypothetical protein